VVVYAQPQERVTTVRVGYSDLNLARQSHKRKLNLRVAGAVRRVCLYEHRSGLQDRGYYNCADRAWEDAKQQIANAVAGVGKLATPAKSSTTGAAVIVSASAQ
jgi:UrcA family protein